MESSVLGLFLAMTFDDHHKWPGSSLTATSFAISGIPSKANAMRPVLPHEAGRIDFRSVGNLLIVPTRSNTGG